MEQLREVRTTSRSASRESGSGARRRGLAPIVLLLLMVGTANLVSRSGQPFVVSLLDVFVLVALVVLTGSYVILARADAQARAAVVEVEQRDHRRRPGRVAWSEHERND